MMTYVHPLDLPQDNWVCDVCACEHNQPNKSIDSNFVNADELVIAHVLVVRLMRLPGFVCMCFVWVKKEHPNLQQT